MGSRPADGSSKDKFPDPSPSRVPVRARCFISPLSCDGIKFSKSEPHLLQLIPHHTLMVQRSRSVCFYAAEARRFRQPSSNAISAPPWNERPIFFRTSSNARFARRADPSHETTRYPTSAFQSDNPVRSKVLLPILSLPESQSFRQTLQIELHAVPKSRDRRMHRQNLSLKLPAARFATSHPGGQVEDCGKDEVHQVDKENRCDYRSRRRTTDFLRTGAGGESFVTSATAVITSAKDDALIRPVMMSRMNRASRARRNSWRRCSPRDRTTRFRPKLP